MSPSPTSPATTDHGGGERSGSPTPPPITALHPDIIHSHILNRLDGSTLAAAACSSAQLLPLCRDDRLWRDICHSTWPSTADPRVRAAVSALPSAHRSLFSDAFPSLRHRPAAEPPLHRLHFSQTPELISAVDISCDGRPIYSKVLVTETSSPWFLCTPLRLDLLDPKETVATTLDPGGGACAARAADRLRVSWILIDPAAGRAASVASRRAVVARRHWLTGDLQLRYAVVVDAGGGRLAECAVAVACRCGGGGGGGMRVVEASMQVVGVEGRVLAGMEGLGVIQAAMAAGRTRPSGGGGRERDVYAAFSRMQARCREGKERREKGLDTACVAAGIAIFVAFFVFLLSR